MSHTNTFLKPYDFSAALALSPAERCVICVERVEETYRKNGVGWWEDIPMVPPVGASRQEIEQLESLLGLPLPDEYFQFLGRWCYLRAEESHFCVWGTNYKGVGMGRPWVSATHQAPNRYLVFADYWKYADGDQLLFDLNNQAVLAYLHEQDLMEYFAPSFSLALWRAVHEGE